MKLPTTPRPDLIGKSYYAWLDGQKVAKGTLETAQTDVGAYNEAMVFEGPLYMPIVLWKYTPQAGNVPTPPSTGKQVLSSENGSTDWTELKDGEQ